MAVGVDVLKGLIPYVVPAVIAFFGVTLGPAFLTTRRVRQDLASDTELLARLQPGSKEHTELAEAVQSRTLHLVSMIHFPAATRLDVLAWLGAVGCAVLATAWLFVMTQPALRPFVTPDFLTAGMALGIGPIGVMTAWVAFQQPWSKRAVGRVRYVRAHLGEDEAEESWRSLRLAEKVSFVVGIVLAVYTLVVSTLASSKAPDAVIGLVVTAAVLAAGLSGLGFIATRRRHGLDHVLPPLLDNDIAVDKARAAEEAEQAARESVATADTRHRPRSWRRLWALLVSIVMLGRRRGQERGARRPSSRC
ncbi:hypothetical protein GCM10023258_30280 [Terrabacter aeriphilus]|uniref:Uncharacterized protein n=1 Tax=Terrabacter aeriphilus TaxID=515662 RepID=A0ABP9JKD2_9MICO